MSCRVNGLVLVSTKATEVTVDASATWTFAEFDSPSKQKIIYFVSDPGISQHPTFNSGPRGGIRDLFAPYQTLDPTCYNGVQEVESMKPIDRRSYRYKNSVNTFFCPLCSTERVYRTRPKLNALNHAQIALLTLISTAALYSVMGLKALFLYFAYWAIFEMSVRVLFRKEVPCPHCGFDASWYKRDVKVARRLVQEFWDQKNSVTSAENVSNKPIS